MSEASDLEAAKLRIRGGVQVGQLRRTGGQDLPEAFGDQRFRFAGLSGFPRDWFARGRFEVQSGEAAGLVGMIKADRTVAGGLRELTLWQGLRSAAAPGDLVRIEVGCDKRLSTCREKFANTLNFQGFPFIPGDDWLTTYPKRSGRNDGGRLAPPVQP